MANVRALPRPLGRYLPQDFSKGHLVFSAFEMRTCCSRSYSFGSSSAFINCLQFICCPIYAVALELAHCLDASRKGPALLSPAVPEVHFLVVALSATHSSG